MFFYGLVMDDKSVRQPFMKFEDESNEEAHEKAREIQKINPNCMLFKYRGYKRKNGKLVIQECLNKEDW